MDKNEPKVLVPAGQTNKAMERHYFWWPDCDQPACVEWRKANGKP